MHGGRRAEEERGRAWGKTRLVLLLVFCVDGRFLVLPQVVYLTRGRFPLATGASKLPNLEHTREGPKNGGVNVGVVPVNSNGHLGPPTDVIHPIHNDQFGATWHNDTAVTIYRPLPRRLGVLQIRQFFWVPAANDLGARREQRILSVAKPTNKAK